MFKRPGTWLVLLATLALSASPLATDDAFYVGGGDTNWTENDVDADWNDTSGGGGTDVAYPGTGTNETATFDTTSAVSVTVAPANAPHIQVTSGTTTITMTAAWSAATVTVDAGASLILQGTGSLNITNLTANGTFRVQGTATATVATLNLASTGSLQVASGATLTISTTVSTFDGGLDNGGDFFLRADANFTTLTSYTNTGTVTFDSSTADITVVPRATSMGNVDCVGGINAISIQTNILRTANFSHNSPSTTTIDNGLIATGNVTINTGTVNLDGASQVDGIILVTSGALDASGEILDANDNITVSGGTFAVGAGSTFAGGTINFTGTPVISIGNVTFDGTGNQTLTPSATNNFTGSITVAASSTLILAGNLNLTSTFTASGGGDLTLNNSVLFSVDGAFTFNTGNLSLGSSILELRNTVTLNTAVVANAAGIIRFDSSATPFTVNNCNRLAGAITTNGNANTVTFDANTLNVASLDCSNAGNVTLNGGLTLSGNLGRSGAGNLTVTGSSSIGGTVTKSGAGTLAFTGGGSITSTTGVSGGNLTTGAAMTFTGAVTVSGTASMNALANGAIFGGNVNLTAAGTVTTGTVTFNGQTLSFSGATNITLGNATFGFAGTATLTLNANDDLAGSVNVNANTTLNVTGNVVFAGTVTVAATGILRFDNNATFTGQTVANSGTIRFDAAGGDRTVTAAGQLNGALSITGGVNAIVFDGNPASGSALTIAASTTLRFTGTMTLGTTTVANSGTIEFAGGTFNVTSGATNLGTVLVSSGTITVTTSLTAGALTVSGAANLTVSTTAGLASLTSSTTGTVTLTGVATITGAVTKSAAGTLALTGGGSIAGDFTVSGGVATSGGTLTLGGANVNFTGAGDVTLGAVTFNRAGTPTAVTLAAANDFNSTVTVSNGTTVNITGNTLLSGTLTVGTGTAAAFNVTGDLAIAAASSVAANGVLGVTGTLTINNVTLTINGSANLSGAGITAMTNGTMAGTGSVTISGGGTFDITPGTGSFALPTAIVNGGTTVNQNDNILLLGSLTLNAASSWDGVGSNLGYAATAASTVTLSVNTGSFEVDTFDGGNGPGIAITVTVIGAGSFTVADLNVPLAATAGNRNMLTLSNTSTGSITVTGDVTVISDDAASAGDGGVLMLSAGAVSFEGDVQIGTSGAGGPAAFEDGCRLSLLTNVTLALGPNGTAFIFAVGRNSVLEVGATSGNEATITVTGATQYAMTLDGGAEIAFLEIDGYDTDGLQLTENFGAASVPAPNFFVNNVNFNGGVAGVGNTNLTVFPDLVALRGGFGAGQALFTEIHFSNGIGDTGFVARAAVVDTSSLKIANAVDDYGLGFTLTALLAETTGVTGEIGGDNDGTDELNNITWGIIGLNNTLTVTNAPSNPFASTIGLGNGQTLMIASFAAAGTDPNITVNSITLTLTGNNIGANIQNLTVTFDMNNDGVGDSPFASPQNPAGAGAISFTGDTQVISTDSTVRLMVIADVVAGVDVDSIRVQIVNAALDVGTDIFTIASGSADSGTHPIASNTGAVGPGLGNPAPQNAVPGNTRTALHFLVSVDVGSPVGLTLTSIRADIQTNQNSTNNAINHIASVTLWRGNGDGTFDAADVLLTTVNNGASGWSVAGDVVSVAFTLPSSILIAQGDFQDFWVSIVFTAVAVGGVPEPIYTVTVDNGSGTALNGGATAGFTGYATGGSIRLGNVLPGDPLKKIRTSRDEETSCELAAGGQKGLPPVLVLLLLAAFGLAMRLRSRQQDV